MKAHISVGKAPPTLTLATHSMPLYRRNPLNQMGPTVGGQGQEPGTEPHFLGHPSHGVVTIPQGGLKLLHSEIVIAA